MDRVYVSTNTVGTSMTYRRGTTQLSQKSSNENIGTCAALSTLWIDKMHDNRPELTKPEQLRAALLFSKNWITKTGEARTYGNIEGADLTPTGVTETFMNIQDLLTYVGNNAGYWLIELSEGHFIAAANVNNEYFLYDSNQALWMTKDAAEFKSHGLAYLINFGWSQNQDIWVYGVTR